MDDDPRRHPLLRYKLNALGDVVVRESSLMHDPRTFEVSVASLVEASRKAKRPAVWINVPMHLAHLLPSAHRVGFVSHHANPTHYTLVRWIDDRLASQHQREAVHDVKVRAVAVRWVAASGIRTQPQVLLVREKRGTWKLPGGSVEEEELLGDAAVREVREETGCATVLAGIVAVCDRTCARWNRNEMTVACLVRPTERDASITDNLVPDGEEVHACEWVAVDDAFARLPATSIDLWCMRAAFGRSGRMRHLEPMPESNAMRFTRADDRLHVHSQDVWRWRDISGSQTLQNE
jgi:8-oxo-dGTP pyrophosphatase MutT (NUDIX family)